MCIIGPEPPVRDFHTAVCIDDKMYLFGGRGTDLQSAMYLRDRETYSRDLWYLDLNTYEWHKPTTTGTKPNGRRSHSACKLNHFYCYCFPTCLMLVSYCIKQC